MDSSCASAADNAEEGKQGATKTGVQADYFTCTNWGGRHDNEDRLVIVRDVLKPRSMDFHLVGVLDGHDTSDASDMVSRALPVVLSKKLKDGLPVSQAYVGSMAELEDRCKKNSHQSAGTCVVNCLLAGRHVWCSNLGDCRACLVFLRPQAEGPVSGAKVQVSKLTWLSRDQKASLPHERDRIIAAGGQVVDGRVEGLEPSRTLGDFDVKMQTKPGVISIIPEVRRAAIGDGTAPTQALLVCGTDGVWDVLSGQDICNIIQARKELGLLQAAALNDVCEDGSDRGPSLTPDLKKIVKAVAEDLVQFSIAKGSRDDCTAVVAMITVAPRL
jgi:serine/threonine protein phosphatase PrpC